MAKGKKSSGTKYVSKGSVGKNKKVLRAIKKDRDPLEAALLKMYHGHVGGRSAKPKYEPPIRKRERVQETEE